MLFSEDSSATQISHLTVEFDDHFVISPSITFYSRKVDFTQNALQESGDIVNQGFEYDSGSNPQFLNIKEIVAYNKMNWFIKIMGYSAPTN